MKAVLLAAVAFAAAVIGAGVDRVFPRSAAGPPAGFEVRDVKWFRTEGQSQISDSGTARIVGTGAATTGRYAVLVEFIRSQRVNPADKPDTLFETAITSGGTAAISASDWVYSCSWSKAIKPPACAPQPRELVASWRVAGWVRLATPPSDSGR